RAATPAMCGEAVPSRRGAMPALLQARSDLEFALSFLRPPEVLPALVHHQGSRGAAWAAVGMNADEMTTPTATAPRTQASISRARVVLAISTSIILNYEIRL